MNENTEPLDEREPAKTEIRGGDKPSDYIPHEKQSGKPKGTGGSGFIGWDDEDDDDA
jgi:hypothetical protein